MKSSTWVTPPSRDTGRISAVHVSPMDIGCESQFITLAASGEYINTSFHRGFSRGSCRSLSNLERKLDP
jgi:hypothetical protein